MKAFCKILGFLFLFSSIINAQFNDYEPEYEWLTLKAEHVYVHFHPEAERTARVVAKIADEVWEPITALYEYEPDEVHYVIKDVDDYSNGATFFFDNKIEIWASALDFDLRGSHNWLRNVISHEFTHMVQIQAAMKIGRTIPAFYFQFLNHEDVRRPDILYGFPNVIVSYPIATINMPAWFAEGTAQYMRTELNYDNWDTHRDMILRSYALDGKLLTWNQMGVFGKTSLGNESVYNSGFALTNYIAQKYGEDKLREITKKLGSLTNFTIDAAFENVLGKDGNEIYGEWTSFIKADYQDRMKDVIENEVSGKIIGKTGFGNFYPTFSKDGSKLFYISNKNSDYFLTGIYEYDINTGKEKKIRSSVRSSVSYFDNNSKLIYAKLSDDNPRWNNIHDIYIYDTKEEEEKRLTFGLRANNPFISHDEKKIVFLYQLDGTTNLGIVDIDGKNYKKLTAFVYGEQVFNPKFSPDDKFIVFGYIKKDNRDIAKVNVDGSGFELLISTDADERNPVFAQDGSFYYSSDETKIFNIYKYNFSNKTKQQVTNVTGGAFYPSVNSNGDIAYAGYTSGGYKLFLISNDEQSKVNSNNQYVWLNTPPLNNYASKNSTIAFDFNYLKNYDDTKLPAIEKTSYNAKSTRITIFPFIRYDNYNQTDKGTDKIKPGVYFGTNDVLNRYSLFASGAINKKLERDLFLIFEFRNKLPLLYNLGLTPQVGVELYSITRETDIDIVLDDLPKINTEVTYDLFEFDFFARHRLFAVGTNVEFRFIFSRYVAKVGAFILNTSNGTLFSPVTKDEYFIGRSFQVKLNHENLALDRDRDINPVGRKISLQYNYEFNKYNPENEFIVQDGIVKPVFQEINFHRVDFNWSEYIPIADGHTVSAKFRVASILGPTVNDFFDFYLGGLIGMKAYPFYAAGGNELGWVNLTYRFPLFREIDMRLGHLYLDKIFLSIYGDYGNAWTGKFSGFDDFKKGVGGEIRLKMNSFYLFPTSIFFNAAYGFDKFERTVREEKITYGKEWRLYGGILFDFSF